MADKSSKNKKEIQKNIIPITTIKKLVQISLDNEVTKMSTGVPEMIAAATAEFIKYLAIGGTKFSHTKTISYDAIVLPLVQQPKFIFLREVFPIKMPPLTCRRLIAEEIESESSDVEGSMEETITEIDDSNAVVPIKLIKMAQRFAECRLIAEETIRESSNVEQVEKHR